MKKIILTALNAKYIHTNLAVRCLKAYVGNVHDIAIVERTINDNIDDVLEEIVAHSPDAVGFSCYIWNIENVLKIASSLKKVLPECTVFMGGPEVSFECKDFLEKYHFIDMIIKGEGEITFSKWIDRFEKDIDFSDIKGIAVRKEDGIYDNSMQTETFDLNSLPFFYKDLSEFQNRIIYFETSRGCPMRCAYCMSGNLGELMYLSIEKVETAFEYFLKSDVKQVKLVDRTFNFPLERAKEILNILIKLKKKYLESSTNFHFEITASLFDDEFLEILEKAPKGLFQFEAGVQSTNKNTLKAISRSLDSEVLLDNLKKMASLKNIIVYADLIAGLPHENYESFKSSFNDVYNTGADKIHLGFLKVLKGSGLKEKADIYKIQFSEYAPYKVLETSNISYLELLKLERVENIVDRYKNSELYTNTLPLALKWFPSPFDFFERFSEFAHERRFFKSNQSIAKQFDLLYRFLESLTDFDLMTLKDVISLDWALMEKPRRYPDCIKKTADEKEKIYTKGFYNNQDNINHYLPDYIDISPSQISRMCHMVFWNKEKKVFLLDYKKEKDNRAIEIIQ